MNKSTEPRQTAKQIFLAASELKDSAEQAAYLDEACAGDTELRIRVVHWLQAAASTHDDPLNRMEVALGISNPSQLSLPTLPIGDTADNRSVGPYRLMEQIGEGGMGVVYVAQQREPIRRTVALKLIKPGMDSKQVVARFEAERQALALMNHPNIAKVLDAGTTRNGLPYFVMELVKGIPITEYCDKHELDLRQRLELFVQVCEAVQHAHQKGIIHRDLKPSNVLVELEDVRSIPKVIDFGVSKATQQSLTENTIYTAFAQIIGTPLYMSPEQAELNSLDVDTRSDVYSLGVILYELITGSTPIDRATLKRVGFDEMRRMIREDEPQRPSDRISTLKAAETSSIAERRTTIAPQLLNRVARELDWIVLKTLEKDRTRRYESASSLASDIERFLSDQPVTACPPSATYRLHKFAKRHKALIGATSFALVSLIAGTILSVVYAVQATKARDSADRANQLAQTRLASPYRTLSATCL